METPIRIKKEEGSPGSGGSEQGDAQKSVDEGKGSAPNTGNSGGSGEKSDGDDTENPSGLEIQPGANEDVSLTFPQRLMEILDNESNSSIIAWVPHGRSFMIYRRQEFENEILPQYFQKQSKYSSFTRKLNRWGFTRVTRGPETGAYFHPLFRRGEHRLVMQMSCNSNVKNPGSSAQIMRAHHRHQQQHYNLATHIPHGLAYYPPPYPQHPYPYAPPPPMSPDEQHAAAHSYNQQQMAYHQYYQQYPPPMPPAPTPDSGAAPTSASGQPSRLPAAMPSPYYPPPPPPAYGYPPAYPPAYPGQYAPHYAPPPYMMSPLPQGPPPPYGAPPGPPQSAAVAPHASATGADNNDQQPSTPQKDATPAAPSGT